MKIGDKVRMLDTRGHVPNGAEGVVIEFTGEPEYDIRVQFEGYGRARVSSNRVEKIMDIKVGDIVEITHRTEQDDDWVEPGVKARVTGIVFGSMWPLNVANLDDPDEEDSIKMAQVKKVETRRPTVGDTVKITGGLRTGETGKVIEDDHDEQPWNVEFPDGGTWWYYKSQVELVESALKKTLTKADLPAGTKVRIVSQGKHGTSLGVGTEGTIVEPFDAGPNAVWVHNPGHSSHGNGIRYAVSELRIIEDAEPKVGDPVTQEVAEALPVGSEIRAGGDSFGRVKQNDGQWRWTGYSRNDDILPFERLLFGYRVHRIAEGEPKVFEVVTTYPEAPAGPVRAVRNPEFVYDRQENGRWKSRLTGGLYTWAELMDDWKVLELVPEKSEAEQAREYFKDHKDELNPHVVSQPFKHAFALAREAMAE